MPGCLRWRAPFYVCAIPGFIVALVFYFAVAEPARGEHEIALHSVERTTFAGLLRNPAFWTTLTAQDPSEARMRAADDYAIIRDRMEQLQRERQQREKTVRDWKDDRRRPADTPLVEEVKKIFVQARFILRRR